MSEVETNEPYLLRQGNNKFTYNDEAPEQGALFAGYASETIKKYNPSLFALSSTYPIYAFLFNLSNIGEITSFDLIPFDWVSGRVNDYVSSMTGDFFEESNNMAWMEINENFFHYCFLNDFIYVEYVAEEEKYNLYYKSGAYKDDNDEDLKNTDDNNWFVNILTAESVYFANPFENLVRCSWNGKQDNRFSKWYRLAYDMEVKGKIIDMQFMLWNKKMFLDIKNNSHITQVDIDLFNKELLNTSTHIHKRTDDGFINFIPNTVAPPADIEIAQKIMYAKFDREAGNMGLVPNLNPKQERLIVAEAHTSMDKQIDEIRRRERQLTLMTLKMEKLGWPPLKFVVNTAENLGLVIQPTPAASGESASTKDAKESQESNKNV